MYAERREREAGRRKDESRKLAMGRVVGQVLGEDIVPSFDPITGNTEGKIGKIFRIRWINLDDFGRHQSARFWPLYNN